MRDSVGEENASTPTAPMEIDNSTEDIQDDSQMQMEAVEDSAISKALPPSCEPSAPTNEQLTMEPISAPPLSDLFQHQPQVSQAEQKSDASLTMSLITTSQQTQMPLTHPVQMSEAPFDMTSLIAASQQVQVPSPQQVFQQAVQTPLPPINSFHPQSKTVF